MSPSASPPTRVPQGASPDFERRANAFLDAARDEDIWSVSESDESDGSESDGSESDARASYDTDESSESDFSASQVDLRELETLIARLHARGAEFVRPKTTQKHRDVHSLVAAAPRASRPTIVLPGSLPGLPDPVLCSLHSEGLQAQREGLSWMKPPGPSGGAAERRDDAKRKRRAGEARSDEDEATRKTRQKRRERRERREAEAYQDRIANASRPLTAADRERRGREVQYAQRLAARRDAEASDADDAAGDASDVAATASRPTSPPSASDDRQTEKGDGSTGATMAGTRRTDDRTKTSERDPKEAPSLVAGRVRLTVCWRARTRARSGAQPTPVSSVLVDVLPGETCMRFMGRVVRMPPGGVYVRDTQLSWGDCILDPMQELGGARTGPWALDLKREPPFELVLRVPAGATLAHRALREAAGEDVEGGAGDGPDAFAGLGLDDDDARVFAEADVRRERRARGAAGRDGARGAERARGSGDGLAAGDDARAERAGSGSSGASGSGSRRRHRDGTNRFATSVKNLSNRALHPGRTDPKGMAALLRSYGAIKDDAACSLVDVGSGDGHFALGLARAFPNAGVCGIEPQRDLYEESLRVAGRDCNFIHGLAENELWRCASARVVMATTHNFDASSVESIVRVAARLPAVTHLVVGQASLCTPRCKAVVGPCCCFVPLGSEEVPTHWGNSRLTFSVYQRVARWVLDADSAARVSDRAALAALERGEIEPVPVSSRDERDVALAKARKREVRKREVHGKKKKGEEGNRRDAEDDDDAEASTPPRSSEARVESPRSPEAPRSPVLESSPWYINRLLRTVA